MIVDPGRGYVTVDSLHDVGLLIVGVPVCPHAVGLSPHHSQDCTSEMPSIKRVHEKGSLAYVVSGHTKLMADAEALLNSPDTAVRQKIIARKILIFLNENNLRIFIKPPHMINNIFNKNVLLSEVLTARWL